MKGMPRIFPLLLLFLYSTQFTLLLGADQLLDNSGNTPVAVQHQSAPDQEESESKELSLNETDICHHTFFPSSYLPVGNSIKAEADRNNPYIDACPQDIQTPPPDSI